MDTDEIVALRTRVAELEAERTAIEAVVMDPARDPLGKVYELTHLLHPKEHP